MIALRAVVNNRVLYFTLSSDAIDNEFERIAREVYNGRLQGGALDDTLIKFTAEHLFGGVTEGFGADFSALDYDTPDYEMLAKLEKDVYWFSSAKNYNELVDLNLSLLDDNGRLRSFDDFKQQAKKIHTRFNDVHLSAEYEQAVASSQMAGKWVRIEADKDSLPLLKYITAGDARVRQQHQALDGIIKPINDPFWDTWYPPNGWNCRCDVIQLSEGKETPDSKIAYPDDMPEYFRNNVGKNGIVYAPEHPYHDLPDKADSVEIGRKAMDILSRNSKAYHRLHSYKNGGKLDVHPLAKADELQYNVRLGNEVAKQGNEVHIRPHTELKGVKNPEAEINGMIADFKEVRDSGTANNIQNHIRSAAVQENEIAVLYLTNEDVTANALKKGIYAALNMDDRNKAIKEVWLLYNDFELVKIKRQEVKGYGFVSKLR